MMIMRRRRRRKRRRRGNKVSYDYLYCQFITIGGEIDDSLSIAFTLDSMLHNQGYYHYKSHIYMR